MIRALAKLRSGALRRGKNNDNRFYNDFSRIIQSIPELSESMLVIFCSYIKNCPFICTPHDMRTIFTITSLSIHPVVELRGTGWEYLDSYIYQERMYGVLVSRNLFFLILNLKNTLIVNLTLLLVKSNFRGTFQS